MLLEGGCGVMIFDLLEEEGLEACRRLSECAIAASSSGEGGSGVAAVRFCRVDVSDEASVRRGFEEFRASFPRLDVMVNCAGIVGPNGVKTDEVTCEDFDRVYAGGRGIVYDVHACHTPLFLHMRQIHNYYLC